MLNRSRFDGYSDTIVGRFVLEIPFGCRPGLENERVIYIGSVLAPCMAWNEAKDA